VGYEHNGVLIADDDLSATFRKVTYRVFSKYQLSKNVNLYANVGTGFRSGGFNDVFSVQQGAPLTYSPENSIFYEVGIKSIILDGKLDFDLAGFTGQYKDIVQLGIQVNPSTHAIVSYYENAGVADIRGVEWDVGASPVNGLRVGFSGDVTNTHFTSVTPQSPVIVGDPIDFVPEYDLVLTGNYQFRWTTGVPGYVNVSSTWKGEMQNTNRDTGIGFIVNRTKPLNFVQASVGAKFDGFDLSIFGRNLTDERGILIPQFSGLTPQARPRSFGISFGKSF